MSVATQVFRLPDLGEGLTEAEVVSWHVAVGDVVGIDQEVVTVETAKAAVEVPCPYAGRVTALHAQPGTVLPVGEPLITVGDMDQGAGGERAGGEGAGGSGVGGAGLREDSPERPLIGYGAGEGPARRAGGRRRRGTSAPVEAGSPPPAAPIPSRPAASKGGFPTPPGASSCSPTQAVRVISPLVRTLAREWDIDLSSVRPGPTGVIRKADLKAVRSQQPQHAAGAAGRPPHDAAGAAGEPPHDAAGVVEKQPRDAAAGAGADVRTPITGVHRLMVERLSTSRREIPDATTWVDVDATRLLRTRDALSKARPHAGIGTLALLARITVAGLTAYPALNSSVDLEAGEIVRHGRINLGIAAQSPRGLVVPVVHDAQALTTAELAQRLRELTEKARAGRLSPAEMTGGTFTLNNYGVYGVDGSTPIINHPEAAMLGVGRIVDKPWVHKGRLRVRKVTQLSLTFDHRVCDGGTAGGLLRLVADCVEDPATLLADL